MIAADGDSTVVQYFVTIGGNNDGGHAAFDEFRVFAVDGGELQMDVPMDATVDGTVYTWSGNSWVEVTYECNPDDAGPCWEPGEQNMCCARDDDLLFSTCAEASMDQEGQWSHDNTNQVTPS